MTTTGKYVITYTGNGIVRLPRAGIFQTGTRAVVDETIARIATVHGCFAVVSLDAPAPLPVAAEPAPPAPVTTAAPATPEPAPEAPRRATRRTGAIRAVR